MVGIIAVVVAVAIDFVVVVVYPIPLETEPNLTRILAPDYSNCNFEFKV